MRLIDFENHILSVKPVNYFYRNQFTGFFSMLQKNKSIECLKTID